MKKKVLSAIVLFAVGLALVATPSDAAGGLGPAKEAHYDGFVRENRDLPSTASVQDAGATIGSVTLKPGAHAVFARLNFDANNTDIVTCILDVPGGVDDKGEFQNVSHGVISMMALTLVSRDGVRVATMKCSDQGPGFGTTTFRFARIIAIPVEGVRGGPMP
jgi:hypothetical protein